MKLEEFNSMQRGILSLLKVAGGNGRSEEDFIEEFQMNGPCGYEVFGFYESAMWAFDKMGFITNDRGKYVLTLEGWKVAEELGHMGPKYDWEGMRACGTFDELVEKFGRRNP